MKLYSRYTTILVFAILIIMSCSNDQQKTGSVIFIHPDGSGLGMWGALRLVKVGPDGFLNWDKMDNLGIYRGHLFDCASASSNAGATAHAFGIKPNYNAFGINPYNPIKSLSGKDYSIMTEAKLAGKSIAVINSGHICEPGTAVFLANAPHRSMEDTIAAQIIHSGADIIFAGGEVMLLPEGVIGFHGEAGIRKDGRNLLEEAKQLGYNVILTRKELLDLPANTDKVLGIFAARNTFNDRTEEKLKEAGLQNYNENAPTLFEMTKVALSILKNKNKDFLIVIEEEGTDNFANHNNANGTIEALSRADDAIGYAMKFIKTNPNTLLITAADSDAGAMQVMGIRDSTKFDTPIPERSKNGSPYDGIEGTSTLPFIAKPDQFGQQHRFLITWATSYDVMGGVDAKAHGFNSEYLQNNVDNTDIYRIMYKTLFGKEL